MYQKKEFEHLANELAITVASMTIQMHVKLYK